MQRIGQRSQQPLAIVNHRRHTALRKATIVKELEKAFVHECDITHRWVLLDSLISLADPGDSNSPPTWLTNVSDQLTPAMRKHSSEALKEYRKKRIDELNRQDNR